MDITTKLAVLADAAKYDASCASSGARLSGSGTASAASPEALGVCHSYGPDGRRLALLKILLTNYCIC